MSNDEYGPDPKLASDRPQPKPASRTLTADAPTPPKTEKPRPAASTRAPRKLTDDDRDKIVNYYVFGSAGVMPFHQKCAQTMAQSAETCADAWIELANENAAVRKSILRIIEGGAWGAVIAAHLPIVMALLPADLLPVNLFAGPPDEPTE